MMITLRKRKQQICQLLKEELMKKFPRRILRLFKSTTKRRSISKESRVTLLVETPTLQALAKTPIFSDLVSMRRKNTRNVVVDAEEEEEAVAETATEVVVEAIAATVVAVVAEEEAKTNQSLTRNPSQPSD